MMLRTSLALLWLMLTGCGAANTPGAPAHPDAAAYSELDRGVGLMGQFDFEQARQVFQPQKRPTRLFLN